MSESIVSQNTSKGLAKGCTPMRKEKTFDWGHLDLVEPYECGKKQVKKCTIDYEDADDNSMSAAEFFAQ